MKKIFQVICCCIFFTILSFCVQAGKTHHLVKIDPAKIDIVRDSFGVPHIFAKTDAEVAYGLAWATCEDDFKTLQWGLLAGRAQMGRLIGKDGARIDYAVKLLRARRTVNEQYDTIFSQHFKELMDGYVQGVNDYARTHPKEVLVKRSFPANAKDLTVAYMMSQCLMAGIDGVLNGMLNGRIKKKAESNGNGSNGFAFNSKITKSDETYLDINAHQPLEGPFSWYEAHVCSEEGWNIVGGLFHGSPCIFLGTNENLGWGHTTNIFDEIDVYSLTMNPKNSNEYKFDGHWEKLETSKAKLVVNLSKKHKFLLPVYRKIWWSKYGPTLKTPHGVMAVRMGALMRVGAAEEWFRMNKARNFSEFRKALDMQQISRQTVIYADRYDTIFILSNGLLPERNPNYDWRGVLPGDTSATLWTSFHPESDLPQVLNPDCGYIFNTNNSGFDCTGPSCDLNPDKYDPTMGYNLERDNRSMRFHELMRKYSKVDWNDFLKIKYDDHFPENDSLVPCFGTYPGALMKLDPIKHPDIADAIKIIQNGRHDGDLDNPDLPIFLFSMYSMREQRHHGNYENDPLALDSLSYNSVKAGKEHMLKYFGNLQVPLGKVQLLVRDTIEMPVSGGPDMIRASYCTPYKDGRLRMFNGESYIQLVKFKTGELPHIETIAPYGSSNKPGSKHYTDQMNMFTHMQRKTMSLDKKYVYAHAESIYHPGVQ